MLTIALITFAVSLLIAGVLYVEWHVRGYWTDNALTRAHDAFEAWRYQRLAAERRLELEAAE